MVKLKLVPYKLTIKDLDKSEKRYPVYVDLEMGEFRKYFEEFIKDHEAIKVDREKERIFRCGSCNFDSESEILYGTFGYGDFGFSSKIINIDNGSTKDKFMNEAEEIPFYYLLKINQNEAYLLLNQFRNRGIKLRLQYQLNKYFNGKGVFGKISVQLNPVVSSKFANIKDLAKIRLIKTRKKRDIEGQLLGNIDNIEQEDYIEERIIKQKGGFFQGFKKIMENLKKNYKEKEYIEIDKMKYNKVKFDVEMDDGSKKVVSLNKDWHLNESIDQDFHGDFPTVNTFFKKSRAYLRRIAK